MPTALPSVGSPMTTAKTTFIVEAMDCPNEANLIRKRLDGFDGVSQLDIDVMRREVVVHHDQDAKGAVTAALDGLGLGAREITEPEAGAPQAPTKAVAAEPWWRKHASLLAAAAASFAAEVPRVDDRRGAVRSHRRAHGARDRARRAPAAPQGLGGAAHVHSASTCS